jgi:hypothetical protein
MANANGIITSPVSIDDLIAVTGNRSTDVGLQCADSEYVSGTVQRANKINKWSKNKPVKHSSLFIDPVADPYWYRGTQQNSGIIIPVGATIAGIFDLLRSGTDGWIYDPPTMGGGNPLRMSDFRGYNHYAIPPFTAGGLKDIYYTGVDAAIGAALDINIPSQYELSVDDLKADSYLQNMYFGIALYRSNIGYQYQTEAVPASQTVGSVEFSLSGLPAGIYEVAAIFAVNPRTDWTLPDVTNSFIPLPDGYRSVTIISDTVIITLNAVRDGTTVTWDLYIYNQSTSAFSLTSCQIRVRYGDRDKYDPIETGEQAYTIGSISINAGQTYHTSGTFTGVLTDYATRSGAIYFINANSDWDREGDFEE